MATRIYWLHALSPTHAGTGRGVGYIDLPIDRDGVTGWPVIRGSAFKGVWADYFRATEEARNREDDQGRILKAAFGLAGDGNNSNAGALIPTDARLVCLPVRSFRGTFAWCASPLCLQMFHRTLTLAKVKDLPPVPEGLDENKAHCPPGPPRTLLKEGKHIYLEDLDFDTTECQTAGRWAEKIAGWVFPGDPAWQEQFQRRFIVISDATFDFLCKTGTEVHTRVKIDDEMKTVASGHLWTEESLPAESILAGLVQCDRVFGRNGEDITPDGLLDQFAKNELPLQIGGKATVGRGQVRCVFTPVSGGGQ